MWPQHCRSSVHSSSLCGKRACYPSFSCRVSHGCTREPARALRFCPNTLRRIPSPVMQNYVHEAIFCNINIFILNASALSDGQKVKLLFEMILICLHLKFYQLGVLRESSQVMACPDLNSCMFTSLSFTLLKACASSCSLIENKFLVLCKPMPLISLFVSKDRQAG